MIRPLPPEQPHREVDQLLSHYAESHRNHTNERIHLVCIPLILLSLIGLLWAASAWLAIAFVAASLAYYARLSIPFLLAMTPVSAIALSLAWALGEHVLTASALVFVLAWIGQFIGHKIEGKKPSFFEDVRYLWVGPLFCLSIAFQALGLRW
ncbi:DUF962 domain-containing protein [Niveibacterium sp. 24ML]|uniref:Mpo1 family 2-hydroxy fatty acid dioxygenase n=1 Tax=Niveibacterium sp. 24ML TaxID=2985512 RepID=UPI002270D7F2|nr:Mpo1-like protein [Niveibacterium sp. 24ML]MCX9155305.1 DUF962 domain-containing protein [Niveibacterium sp. 24ML]